MKKSSMSLGVNSIIVLIIAVIVLGLVIGFINGMFKQVKKQITPPECTPQAPSGSQPLTMCPQVIIASPGETVAANVMVYNKEQKDFTLIKNSNYEFKIECTTYSLIGDVDFLRTTVKKGESKKMAIQFKIANGVGKGEYVCRLYIKNLADYYQDFRVRVE